MKVILFIFLGVVLLTPSGARPEVSAAKVTSIYGNVIELDLGSEKGIKSGDSGRVYYTVKIGGQDKRIFVAKFKITYLSEKSSMAQIEEKTAEIKVGYLVEVILSSGELEVKSDPPGAKVYVDGKEVGQSPVILSNVRIGRHQIQVTKEGYESYEVWEEIGIGRLKVLANLKKKVKEANAVAEPVKSTEVTPAERGTKRAVVDWTQKKFEAPVLNVGDQWRYKDVTDAVLMNEVLDIKEGLYIIKEGGRRHLSGYDKKTMNFKFLIEESGKRMENKSNWRNILDFPMFVGKKWTETTVNIPDGRQTEATFLNEFEIEAIEGVNTAAGTFRAFRIRYQQTNKSVKGSGWVRLWYSPETKSWVKREFEKSPFWSKVKIHDSELISYKLK
jgi:hypothetical protein